MWVRYMDNVKGSGKCTVRWGRDRVRVGPGVG